MNLNSTHKNQKGFSLLETVAAIVLITILLLSFVFLFVQSKQVGKASELILDATYYAQKDMENIYSLSKSKTVAQIHCATISDSCPYTKNSSLSNETKTVFNRTHPDAPSLQVSIEIQKTNVSSNLSGANFHNVIVIIKEDNLVKASMENVFKFK